VSACRLIDLQVEDHRAYFRLLRSWRPEIVAFSCNYLANVPEIVDLAKARAARLGKPAADRERSRLVADPAHP
jgi:hypothetical protein